jgi:hypothetical protein
MFSWKLHKWYLQCFSKEGRMNEGKESSPERAQLTRGKRRGWNAQIALFVQALMDALKDF